MSRNTIRNVSEQGKEIAMIAAADRNHPATRTRHKCLIEKCNAEVRDWETFCGTHWLMVPTRLRNNFMAKKLSAGPTEIEMLTKLLVERIESEMARRVRKASPATASTHSPSSPDHASPLPRRD